MALQVGELFAKLTIDSSGFKRGLEDAKGAIEKTKTAIAVAATGIAGGIAASFGASVKSAMDFQQSIQDVKAVMDPADVAKYGGQLKQLALTMGAETKYNATEAAQAIGELVKAGVNTEAIMNGGLKGALDLATAGELSVADAAEIASTALNAFKADNLSVAKAGDILAGAANASATSVGELKFGLSSVAAVAASVGMSFKDTTTGLAIFAQNGLKGQDAGTSLKSMLMNLQPSSKAAAEAMQQLGLTTKNGTSIFFDAKGHIKSMADIAQILQGNMKGLNDAQRLQAMQTIFGSDAIRAANILYKEGAKGVQDMNKAMSAVTADQVAKTKMDTLKGAIENMKGSLETAAITFGDTFLPALTDAAKGADDFISKLGKDGTVKEWAKKAADGLNELKPVLATIVDVGKQIVDHWDGISAVIGGAASAFASLKIINTVVGLWNIYKASAFAATLAQSGLNAALIANPIGIIVVAIGALVAAGIYLYKNWDTVKAKAGELWSSVKKFFGDMTAGVEKAWNDLINNAEQIGHNIIEGLAKGLGAAVGEAVNAAKSVASQVSTAVKEFFGIHSPSRLMAGYGQNISQGLGVGISQKAQYVVGEIQKLSASASKAAQTGAEKITAAFNAALDDLRYNTQMDYLSVDDQLAVLNKIKSTYAKTLEQQRQINIEIHNLEKQQAEDKVKQAEEAAKASFDASKKWIDERKFYNELSAEDELAAWERVAARYAKGTEERTEADHNAYTIREQIIEQAINQEYDNTVKAIDDRNEALKEELDKEKDLIQQREDAALDALKNEEQAQLDSLDRQEKAYEKSINDQIDMVQKESDARVKSLQDQMDALDKQASAEDYADQVKDQQDQLAKLQQQYDFYSQSQSKAAQSKATDLLDQINKLKIDMDKAARDQEIKAQKDQLQSQIDAIKSEADNQKQALQDQLDAQKEAFEQQKTDMQNYYDRREKDLKASYDQQMRDLEDRINREMDELKREKDNAEKQKNTLLDQAKQQAQQHLTIVTDGQNNIIQILNDKGEEYFKAGEMAGSQLANGLESTKSQIQSIANSLLSISGSSSQTSSSSSTSNKTSSSSNSTKSSVNADGFNIYNPEPSGTYYTDGTFVPKGGTKHYKWNGVNWYGKGGIFNEASVIGVGEAGTEAVLPIKNLVPMMTEALANATKRLGAAAMGAGMVQLNLTFTGGIQVRDDNDIRQISRELSNLTQAGIRRSGRRLF